MTASNCEHTYQDIADISVCAKCGHFELGELTTEADEELIHEAIGHIFEAVSLLKRAGAIDSAEYKAGGILTEGKDDLTTWSLQVQEGVGKDV